MANRRALVTGGAGFVGSHLVDSLVSAGYKVRIIDALVEQVHGGKIPEHLNPDAEFIHANLNDREAVAKALHGVEVVFHQAAEVGIAQSMYEIHRYVHGNDLATATLLEEIVERRDTIRKVVVASSHSIYGEGACRCENCGIVSFPETRSQEQLAARSWDYECTNCGNTLVSAGTPESKPNAPTSVYAINKQNHEQYSLVVGRAYKIPTVALRYFNIYGPRQSVSNPYTGVCAIFSAKLLNDKAPHIYEDGLQTRDFIHVSDIVAANLKCIETSSADYQVMNIGTGTATTIKDVAVTLGKVLGKEMEPKMTGQFREGDIRGCIADISRARQLIGFEPKVRFEDGLGDLAGWLANGTALDRTDHAAKELAAHGLVG